MRLIRKVMISAIAAFLDLLFSRFQARHPWRGLAARPARDLEKC